jgi:hypothetical protein
MLVVLGDIDADVLPRPAALRHLNASLDGVA